MTSQDEIVNLLKEIRDGLPKLIANAKIRPDQVQVRTLDELTKNLGLFQAGEFRGGNGKEIGKGFSGVSLSESGLLVYKNDVITGFIDSDGDWSVGSDLSAPGTTGFKIFSTAQTYNGEAMGAGDILIGDNSTGKGNILWDSSAGALYFRTGLIVTNVLSTGSVAAIGAQLSRVAGQTINTGTGAYISFDTVNYDDNSFTNLGATPTRITIPTTGRYVVRFYIISGEAYAAARATTSIVLINGSAASIVGGMRYIIAGAQYTEWGSQSWPFTAGEYMQLQVINGDTANHTYMGSLSADRIR